MANRDMQARRAASGFTLVELLIVVAILAILMGLLSGAIRDSVANAHQRRIVAKRAALESGIVSYWHDYNRWPVRDNEGGSGDVRNFHANNHVVFDRLSTRNVGANDNPLTKAYMDETAHITVTDVAALGAVEAMPASTEAQWLARQSARNMLRTTSLARRRENQARGLPIVYVQRRRGDTTVVGGARVDVQYGIMPFRVTIDLRANTVSVD